MKQEPSYIQIYNQIKKDIIEGVYEYGKKLPSKRQLAFDTETSVITIEHAYSILLEEVIKILSISLNFTLFWLNKSISNASIDSKSGFPSGPIGHLLLSR